MTSLLSTEKQQFSQDGLYGVSWQQVVPDAKYPLPSQVHRILAATSATGRVVEDLVAAASSAAVSASVGTGLCISNVPYIAFENLVDSSLSTLTVTYLSHVTEVLSPAFSAGTLSLQSQRHFFDVRSGRQCQERRGCGLQRRWQGGTRHLHCALDNSRVPEN